MNTPNVDRYSDDSIEVLKRPKLYKLLLQYIAEPTNETIVREIRQDEALNHELVAYRVYGLSSLRWIVRVMTGLTDEYSRLPVGFVVRFPPKAVIASYIRQVKDNA